MSSTKSRPRWSVRRATTVLAIAAVIAVAGGGGSVWAYSLVDEATATHNEAMVALANERSALTQSEEAHQARVDAERKRQNETARAKSEAEEQQRKDEYWKSLGYEVVDTGLYFKWLDQDKYTCGRYDCAGFAVHATEGCPTRLYLEAAIESQGSQVDWTNETFTSIERNGTVTGFFDDIYGQGDGFNLTKVNCY